MRDLPLPKKRIRPHHRVRLQQTCGCLFEAHLFAKEIRINPRHQVPVFVEISARCAGCKKPYKSVNNVGK